VDDRTRLEQDINQGGSLIDDHPFVPRRKAEPWGLCVCGLGEAAHAESEVSYRSVLAARKLAEKGKAKDEAAPEFYVQGKVVPIVPDGD
jgi:hypothetical protein